MRWDVDRRKPADLLFLVNKWGHLGVGGAGKPASEFDSVRRTIDEIVELQTLGAKLEKLREGRTKLGQTKLVDWYGFANRLNVHLWSIHPAVEPTPINSPRDLRPTWRPRRLLDVLYLQLWIWVTEARSLRRCPFCYALFAPGRANQLYCARQCAVHAAVQRFRRRNQQGD